MSTQLLFPLQSCDNSLICKGCSDIVNNNIGNLNIYNRDLIVYDPKLDLLINPVYYQLISSYEDVIRRHGTEIINQSDDNYKYNSITDKLIPERHYLTIGQYATFDEVENLVGIWACGGCRFILSLIDTINQTNHVLCTNGWPNYDNGWHDE